MEQTNTAGFEIVEAQTADRDDLIAALRAQRPLLIRGVDLSGVDLGGLDLTGSRFERCILIGADLTGATLDSTTWQACRGAAAVFKRVSASDAQFLSSDLNNTKWERAKLTHAKFRGSKLTGADLTGCSTLGLTFRDTLLHNSFVCGISFFRENLEGLDFTDADLAGCDFRHAVFNEGCSLANARITDARFQNADLRGADLTGIHMSDASQFKQALINPSQAAQLIKGQGLRVSY